jgi:hypothetical protein
MTLRPSQETRFKNKFLRMNDLTILKHPVYVKILSSSLCYILTIQTGSSGNTSHAFRRCTVRISAKTDYPECCFLEPFQPFTGTVESIYYRNQSASQSVTHVDCYIIIRKLLHSNFNIFPVYTYMAVGNPTKWTQTFSSVILPVHIMLYSTLMSRRALTETDNDRFLPHHFQFIT